MLLTSDINNHQRASGIAKTQAPWPFSRAKTWAEQPWLWRGLYAAVGVGSLAALAKLALSQREARSRENTEDIQSRNTFGGWGHTQNDEDERGSFASGTHNAGTFASLPPGLRHWPNVSNDLSGRDAVGRFLPRR